MTIPERRMRKHVYEPIGRCVYCGSDGGELGLRTEHIIPAGLGGRLELLKASCHECEKETHALEGRILGGLYGASRAHLGVRREKRSKAQWPKSLPVSIADSSGASEIEVPIEYHPELLRVIKWFPPEILGGLPADDGEIKGALMDGYVMEDFRQRLARIGPNKRIGLTSKTGVTVDDFARFLAKIGHCFAIAERGSNYFRPFLLNAILNRRPMYLPYYTGMTSVGGSMAPDVHELAIREDRVKDHTLVIVRIQLFADIGVADRRTGLVKGMPAYDVVVGSVF